MPDLDVCISRKYTGREAFILISKAIWHNALHVDIYGFAA